MYIVVGKAIRLAKGLKGTHMRNASIIAAADSIRSDMLSYYSDFYKDVHGIRPRGEYLHFWTAQDFQDEIDSLRRYDSLDEEWEAECARDRQERRDATCARLGIDSATYARWMADLDRLEDAQDRACNHRPVTFTRKHALASWE